MRYSKMLAQVVAAVLTALIPLLVDDGPLGPIRWMNVALVALGAAAVFAGPNVPGASITKTVLSVLTAIAVVLQDVIASAGGVLVLGPADWLQIALAALAAVGVYTIPNRGEYTLAR